MTSCDTFVALSNSTEDGSVLFAKNSDRDPNEPHHVVYFPRQQHSTENQVQCTYISIPQVAETYAVLLCKPVWMWGAEMGVNEFGVVIGNEAIITKIKPQKTPSLLGMDYLRLALERSKSANEALDVITSLLHKYGQGGNCGFTHEFYYHNSFLIADFSTAWILETVDREWVARKVEDIASISNIPSISHRFDKISEGMLTLATKQGWLQKTTNETRFTFASSSPEFLFAFFGEGRQRMCRSYEILQQSKGRITVRTMMSITRDHWPYSSKETLNYGLTGQSICMHAGFGPIRRSQTTCSLIVHLRKDGTFTVWVTGTSAPCLSLYKPVLPLHSLPHQYNVEPNHHTADSKSLWWTHERLHRTVLVDYETRIAVISNERMELESLFLHEEELLRMQSESAQCDWVQKCWEKAINAEERWLQKVQTLPVKRTNSMLYTLAWIRNNKQVGFNGIPMSSVIPWKKTLFLIVLLWLGFKVISTTLFNSVK